MMSFIRKSSHPVSSRRQIGITGVKNDILVLPNDQYRLILEVSSLNFELKSEAEQDVLIDSYESFLNALPTPVQIIVRTRELNLANYSRGFEANSSVASDTKYQAQLEAYEQFLGELITANKILSRRFYVVIPVRAGDIDQAKIKLSLFSDLISAGLMRLGITTTRVNGSDILELFHQFYAASAKPLPSETATMTSNFYIESARG